MEWIGLLYLVLADESSAFESCQVPEINKEIKHDNSKYPTTAGLNRKIIVKPPIHHRFEIVSVMLNHRYIRLPLHSYVAKLRSQTMTDVFEYIYIFIYIYIYIGGPNIDS